jgi:hypothetical protein|tara:strand:+ start:667 stop:1515 length:849 start_codon:yes stop_codon:yes gene_type:complete
MKKSINTSAVLIMMFSLTIGHAQSWFGKKIVGNGNVTTKSVSTEDYDHIKSVGSVDIHLIKGTEGVIAVTTDDNLHAYLDIKVENSTLIIKIKDNINLKTKEGFNINVPFEDISKVTLTGSGDMDTKDSITSDAFKISLSGSGDVVLDVNASKVQTEITGSGTISLSGDYGNLKLDLTGSGNFVGTGMTSQSTEVTIGGSGNAKLSGTTSKLKIEVIGSGSFKGLELDSNDTDVKVAGSGQAKVVANEILKARVNGSGTIVYKGNPENVNNKTNGSGKIKRH